MNNMANALEEFRYGNLEPTEHDTSPSPECKELLQLFSRNAEKLRITMTDAQKDLFSQYQDCIREFRAIAGALLSQSSFRLGSKIMMEIMKADDMNCSSKKHIIILQATSYRRAVACFFRKEMKEACGYSSSFGQGHYSAA